MDYGFVEESKKSEIIKSGGGSLLRVKSEYLTLKQCLSDNTEHCQTKSLHTAALYCDKRNSNFKTQN